MYQILYEGEPVFDSRLDGRRVLSPVWESQDNGAGTLKFDVTPDHPLYGSLQKLSGEVVLLQDGEWRWTGRIINDEMAMDKTKAIECEGVLAYTLDSIQRPWSFTGAPADLLAQFVTAHNGQVGAGKQLTVGTVDVTDPNNYINRSNSGYETTWKNLTDHLLDSVGGHIKVRVASGTKYLDWTTAAGRVNTQVIDFGKNILSLKRYVKGEDVKTAIIPLGKQDETTKERLTVATVNDGKDYVYDQAAVDLYGWVVGVVQHDDITLPANLLTAGYADLAEQKLLGITLELNALDLHLLDVDAECILTGDSVRVRSAPHGIDEQMVVSKMSVYLAEPDKTTITLGSTRTSLTDDTASGLKAVGNVVEKVVSDYATNTQLTAVKGTANAANAAAAAANAAIAGIANDDLLTPVEKSQARLAWDAIAAEKDTIDGQAVNYGVSATAYDAAFQALADYLNGGSTWSTGAPAWLSDANLGSSTAIDGDTWRTKWNGYYSARADLQNACMVLVNNKTATLESSIDQTADQIKLDVAQTYATQNALDTEVANREAALSVQADSITAKFEQSEAYTRTVEDQVTSNQTTLETYIRFDADGMWLGKQDSPFIAHLTNTQLAFLQNNQAVAYISNNKLYITDAEVSDKLTIGNAANGWFDFTPRANGNLSFKFRGGA